MLSITSRTTLRQGPLDTYDQEDRILLVDDDLTTIHLMSKTLSGVGRLRFATTGRGALELARESTPDLILLDAQMPDMSGFKVFEAINADLQLADVPVIFVTSHKAMEFEVSALDMGAVDFISKPISPALLRARVKTHLRIKHVADALRCAAPTDRLTGAVSLRPFEEVLEREWRRACRAGAPLSLLAVGVNDFNRYHKHYGHLAGDVCLTRVASALQNSAHRAADLVCRFGVAEFLVLLPGTARRGAEHVVRRILHAIDALGIANEASPAAGQLVASIGLASFDEASVGWSSRPEDLRYSDDRRLRAGASELIVAADQALQAARSRLRPRPSPQSGGAASSSGGIAAAPRGPAHHLPGPGAAP
jgi:diguanylate cyclase (GGDEF)-like protein